MDDYPSHNTVLAGDYNLPEAVWLKDDLGLLVRCPNNSFANTIQQYFSYITLFQCNAIYFLT